MSDKETNSLNSLTYSFITKVQLDDVPHEGLCIQFCATNKELRDIEQRLCLEKLNALEAEVTLLRRGAGSPDVEVQGTMRACFVQYCVVTFEPLDTAIEAAISARFSEDADTEEDDCEFGLDDELLPEMIVDGSVDVGEAIIQQLALEIDPFPRSPGVPYMDVSSGEIGTKNGPFMELSGLRDKLEN